MNSIHNQKIKETQNYPHDSCEFRELNEKLVIRRNSGIPTLSHKTLASFFQPLAKRLRRGIQRHPRPTVAPKIRRRQGSVGVAWLKKKKEREKDSTPEGSYTRCISCQHKYSVAVAREESAYDVGKFSKKLDVSASFASPSHTRALDGAHVINGFVHIPLRDTCARVRLSEGIGR